jgi:hypothetical protein
MAVDKNPRHWFIDATNIEANVDANNNQDWVTIEFAGRLSPSTKERLLKALKDNHFTITEKRLA